MWACRVSIFTALVVVFVPVRTWAQTSNWRCVEMNNQRAVRESLERDGWRVVYYGKITTEEKDQRSIVTSVYLKNPKPFKDFMASVMQESYTKINKQVPGLMMVELTRLLDQSVRERRIVEIRNLELDAGFATYKRWLECYPDVIHSEINKRTETLPLPNWYQFYVRYRVVSPRTQP